MESAISNSRSNPNSSNRIDIVCLCVLIISAILPLLGLGAYFRNEDARYLYYFKSTPGILNALSYTNRAVYETFRPIYELALRIIYSRYGNNPLPYQVVSGLLFIWAITLYYKNVTLLLENKTIAFISILAFFSNFYFCLHFLYTPIQGFQFPLELLLFTGSIFFLLKYIKAGRLGLNLIISIVLAVCAIFTHPVSTLLLPLLCITLLAINWKECEDLKAKRWSLILFYALLWLVIPLTTKAGETKMLGVDKFYEYFPIMLNKYILYNGVILRKFNIILLSLPLFYSLSRFLISRFLFTSISEKRKVIAYSISLAIVGLILVTIIPREISFIVITVVLIATAFIDKVRLLLVVWFFGGIGPNLFSPAMTGTYVRHSAMALGIIMGITYWELIKEIALPVISKAKHLARVFSLDRVAVFLTVVLVALVSAAKFNILKVPLAGNQIAQVNYLKDMGNNFRDVVLFLCDNLDEGARVHIFEEPPLKQMHKDIYTQRHLERLQPAKSKHDQYQYYFKIYGREDISVRYIKGLANESNGSSGEKNILIATNNWEVDYLESNYSLEEYKVYRRRSAVSKIYYFTQKVIL